MSTNYLSAYENLIPAAQQQRLLAVLSVNAATVGANTSQTALEAQIQALISQLEKPLGTPQMQYREAAYKSKISSNDYNQMMQETFVDLGAIYAQDNNIDNTISVHRNLNNASISDAQAALHTVANDVAVYQIVNNNRDGINSAVFNNFYKNDNTYIDPVYETYFDSDTNSITLPQGSVNDALNINGLSMASISTTTYGGGIKGVLSNNQATPDQAIDGSSSSFWAEVIMAPQPITQVYNGSTVFGPVCEVVISLNRIELVNYVRFDPFSPYPLNVLYIKYRSSSTANWTDTGITPQTSTGIMEFYFNDITVKDIMIVINQECPSVNTYQIPQSQINNSLLWQQIANDELSIVDSAEPPNPSTQDMIDYQPGWQAFSDATQGYKDNLLNIGYPPDYVFTGDVTPSIFKAATQQITATTDTGAQTLSVQLYNTPATGNDTLVSIRMYEYVYGAYDINVQQIWYVDTGIYASPIYAAPGTVVEAEIDTTDYAPVNSTIEYQLSSRPGEWLNIIPNGGASHVVGERIVPNPLNLTGSLRFSCSGVPSNVYMNDVVLASGTYTFSAPNNSITLLESTYVSAASYTADYATASGSIGTGKINFLGDALISAEEIYTGQPSDQFKISTQHFPFINYNIINDTIIANPSGTPDFAYTGGRWLNVNPSGSAAVQNIAAGAYYDPLLITVNGFAAENMTDYYNGERPALTQYNAVSYPYYNYFHSENNIYFNTPVSGLEFKTVYQYLNGYIQMRATLRNNLVSNVTQTPSISDFTIKMRTI